MFHVRCVPLPLPPPTPTNEIVCPPLSKLPALYPSPRVCGPHTPHTLRSIPADALQGVSFRQPARPLRPSVGACERCPTSFFPIRAAAAGGVPGSSWPVSGTSFGFASGISGGGGGGRGLNIGSAPTRFTRLHSRSLRGPFHPAGDFY